MALVRSWQFGGIGLFALMAPALAHAEEELLDVPSGQPLTFHEMLWDRPGGGLVYRFRFIAPEIGPGGREFDQVVEDLDHLCQEYALPKIATIVGPKPHQVVISLSQQPTEFGVATPDIVQFFEAYRIENETCIWEAF